jgi:hypothetical protein
MPVGVVSATIIDEVINSPRVICRVLRAVLFPVVRINVIVSSNNMVIEILKKRSNGKSLSLIEK